MIVQKDAKKEVEKQQLAEKLEQELMQEVRTIIAQNNNLLPTQEVMLENILYNFHCNVLN